MAGLTATLTKLSAKYGQHVGLSRRAGRVLGKAKSLSALADYAAAVNKMPKRKGKSKMTVWRERVALKSQSLGGASLSTTTAAAKGKGRLATSSTRARRTLPAVTAAVAAVARGDNKTGVRGSVHTTTAVVAAAVAVSGKRSIAAVSNTADASAVVVGTAAAEGSSSRSKRYKAT
jgi:hypothetical protein